MISYSVLIVEDEAPQRNNLARIVKGCGYQVITANDGIEACRIIQANMVDIVLSDLRMPLLDGFGLLKWMRSNQYAQPVIVTSGNGMIESAIAALRLGAYDYLIKPFKIEDIAAALRRAESSILAHRANLTLAQRNRELAALTTISAAGSSTLDLTQMLSMTIPTTMEVLGVNGAIVYLRENDSCFKLHSTYGTMSYQDFGLPKCIQITDIPHVLIGADAVYKTLQSSNIYDEMHGIPIVALLPLQAHGNLCGVVLLTSNHEQQITQEQHDLLLSIGNIVGVGVSNARMYGELLNSAIYLEEQVAVRTRELQRSRDLLRKIFDGIPNGLVLLDHEGTVLAANLACAELLQLRPQDLVGAKYQEIWPASRGGASCEMLDRCFNHNESTYRRTRIEHNGRSPIMLDCYLFPVPSNSADEAPQVIEYLDNVTERLSLEQVVAQTEQLAALGKLAATVAHEVNTPLLAIRGCVSLAADADDSELRNEYLTLAQGELDRAAAIIQGLLDFYRPVGQVHVGTNLNGLVTQVLQLLHAECLHNDIDVVQELDPHLPDIHGSPDQLKQVLLNLVLNAIEAMESGGRLLIRTSRASDPDHPDTYLAVVKIYDTGSGIPEHLLGRLFDAFVTTKDDGNGLGLAVCRTIVRDHGGLIEAENTPEGGACFTVKLPVKQALTV